MDILALVRNTGKCFLPYCMSQPICCSLSVAAPEQQRMRPSNNDIKGFFFGASGCHLVRFVGYVSHATHSGTGRG